MKMRHRILALLVILCVAATQTALASQAAHTGSYVLGDKLEELLVPTTDGQTTSLYSLLETHRAVLAGISGLWAANGARKNFRYLRAYPKRMGMIWPFWRSLPMIRWRTLPIFSGENGLRFWMGSIDLSIAVEQFVPDDMFPTTLLIDRNGVCCYQQVGAFDSEKTVERLVLPVPRGRLRGTGSDDRDTPLPQPTAVMPSAAELAKSPWRRKRRDNLFRFRPARRLAMADRYRRRAHLRLFNQQRQQQYNRRLACRAERERG